MFSQMLGLILLLAVLALNPIVLGICFTTLGVWGSHFFAEGDRIYFWIIFLINVIPVTVGVMNAICGTLKDSLQNDTSETA